MKAVIALGSNLGDRRRNVEQAVLLLAERVGAILHRSSWIDTEPLLHPESPAPQPRYLNGVVLCETALRPLEVLHILLDIELELGRVRNPAVQWGPRTIDLDFIAMESTVFTVPELVLPHPEMHRREFVLAPLCEIYPTWRHPILKRTAEELLTEYRRQELD